MEQNHCNRILFLRVHFSGLCKATFGSGHLCSYSIVLTGRVDCIWTELLGSEMEELSEKNIKIANKCLIFLKYSDTIGTT